MNRRQFAATATMLATAACAPGRRSSNEGEAVKQVVSDYYDLFYRRLDKDSYRALLTDDYLLLENGEVFDADGDMSSMPKPGDGYTRSDKFDFRSVHVDDCSAYAVYVLRSDVTEKKDGQNAARHMEWLESAILRRAADKWRVAILHSTPITKSAV